MRYHLDLPRYDLAEQDALESPNSLFIAIRTVVYADGSQKGDKTHRLVLGALQLAVDGLVERYQLKVWDRAEDRAVQRELVRLKPAGGRLGGKEGIDKAAFELLKTLAKPLIDGGQFNVRVATRLESLLEDAVAVDEGKKAGPKKGGS